MPDGAEPNFRPETARILVSDYGVTRRVEISHAIVFLASDESSCTGGSESLINGGMSHL
jgi:hypothetical protein